MRYSENNKKYFSYKVRYSGDNVRYSSDKVRYSGDNVRYSSNKVRYSGDNVRYTWVRVSGLVSTSPTVTIFLWHNHILIWDSSIPSSLHMMLKCLSSFYNQKYIQDWIIDPQQYIFVDCILKIYIILWLRRKGTRLKISMSNKNLNLNR